MAKVRTEYRCTACGASALRWEGRCPACGAWNTVVEHADLAASVTAEPPAPVTHVVPPAYATRSTGIGELDRVLGGGLVEGSVTLVGGEPGIGKSTLLLQALAAMAHRGQRTLLVSAEESRVQVHARAERLNALEPQLWLAAETELTRVLAAIEEIEPTVVVVDSIQTIRSPASESAPGSTVQVRDCAAALIEVAKQRGPAVLLVGHVTKDGALAGPRALEHAVDTVLSFEGDRHHSLRLLRAVKHRFGPTGELGLFEMGEQGLRGVADPSALFLADRQPSAPGSIVAPVIEGARTLLVEIQSLVVARKSESPLQPRRSALGVDGGRLAMVIAVLGSHGKVPLGEADVFASAVGGVRVTEPAADLAVACALASSHASRGMAPDLVAVGEVGLAGEVRQVAAVGRRLAEAARLGFRRALVPARSPDGPPGLQLLRVASVAEALTAAGVRG